jgi:hypothetical protein
MGDDSTDPQVRLSRQGLHPFDLLEPAGPLALGLHKHDRIRDARGGLGQEIAGRMGPGNGGKIGQPGIAHAARVPEVGMGIHRAQAWVGGSHGGTGVEPFALDS